MYIETEPLPWLPTDIPGVTRKPLQSENTADQAQTALLRLESGSPLPTPEGDQTLELFLLEGSLVTPAGLLKPEAYARIPNGHAYQSTAGDSGAILFHKTSPDHPGDSQTLHLQSDTAPWLPGQGNLRVKPLHSIGTQGTALVHWPKDERFLPHRHMGGEEILVLSGTFRDEHGAYPTNCWMQSPHNSVHHPFVIEETVILVKTGHLPPG